MKNILQSVEKFVESRQVYLSTVLILFFTSITAFSLPLINYSAEYSLNYYKTAFEESQAKAEEARFQMDHFTSQILILKTLPASTEVINHITHLEKIVTNKSQDHLPNLDYSDKQLEAELAVAKVRLTPWLFQIGIILATSAVSFKQYRLLYFSMAAGIFGEIFMWYAQSLIPKIG